MKLPGMFGTLSLVSGLVLAIPMAIIGFEMLAQDRLVLATSFLGLAVVMLVLPDFILRRVPGPRTAIRRRIHRFRGRERED